LSISNKRQGAAELSAGKTVIGLKTDGAESRSDEAGMIRNCLRIVAFLLFASFAAYSAFVPAHAGSGYGVDELASQAK